MKHRQRKDSALWAMAIAMFVVIYLTIIEQTELAPILLGTDSDDHVSVAHLRMRIVQTLPVTALLFYAADRIFAKLRNGS